MIYLLVVFCSCHDTFPCDKKVLVNRRGALILKFITTMYSGYILDSELPLIRNLLPIKLNTDTGIDIYLNRLIYEPLFVMIM